MYVSGVFPTLLGIATHLNWEILSTKIMEYMKDTNFNAFFNEK